MTPGFRGRGSPINPQNRFEAVRIVADPDIDPGYAEPGEEAPSPRTVFLKDLTETILSRNQSPDLGFGYSMNAYRGCEHGCAYCYARPTHEYLGLSAGIDFETRIFVKEQAPRLLRQELSKASWKPQVVMMSGVTDCYQPAERRFRLTRACLEVFAEFRNPVGIVTKNFLVTRDLDVLSRMAADGVVSVMLSVTSLDPELSRRLEPRASSPARRLEAVRLLNEAGIPAYVNVAPVIPGLNDHEIPRIVQAAAEAGAWDAGMSLVRFPYGVREVFLEWLHAHYPEKANGVISRIREYRDGELSDPRWNTRHTGEGPHAEALAELFRVSCLRAGLPRRTSALSTDRFRRPGGTQLELL
ncbi:MAG: PA0069 family radical SAM protein [Verrucomicrobium sp.]|nr:PA0069 family radical SAM protein [Verrucomicrobium sp.]